MFKEKLRQVVVYHLDTDSWWLNSKGMESLKIGDIFALYEENKRLTSHHGMEGTEISSWKVMTKPKQNENDKVWGVEAEPTFYVAPEIIPTLESKTLEELNHLTQVIVENDPVIADLAEKAEYILDAPRVNTAYYVDEDFQELKEIAEEITDKEQTVNLNVKTDVLAETLNQVIDSDEAKILDKINKPAMNDFASKSLGDSTSYAIYTDKFDPTLLNPMPRALARNDHGITGDEFDGFDVWHCHESTFLLDSGKPVSGTLKFVYSASSEFMVESKSMKLYLNSFDMAKMGATTEEAIEKYEQQVQSDLEKILGSSVQAKFFKPGKSKSIWEERDPTSPYRNYRSTYLDDIVRDSVVFDDYNSTKNYIRIEETDEVRDNVGLQRWWTNSLRSRCRHTKQKDTGSAFFAIRHQDRVNPVSLFKQVVALREVNEFHEFCAEKLFVNIQQEINPEQQSVMLLYSRRGSLDINPVRFTKPAKDLINTFDDIGRGYVKLNYEKASFKNLSEVQALIDVNLYTTKAFGQ